MAMVAQALPQNGSMIHAHPDHPNGIALKFVALDTSQYLIQRIRLPSPPSVNDPAGDTIFDSTLSVVPLSPGRHFAPHAEP